MTTHPAVEQRRGPLMAETREPEPRGWGEGAPTGAAAEAFLRRAGKERLPALVWPLPPATSRADVDPASGRFLPEGWAGPVVYLLKKWPRSREGVRPGPGGGAALGGRRPGGRRVFCEWPETLDSVHADAESARSRARFLAPRGYLCVIDVVELHQAGHDPADVVSLDGDGVPHQTPLETRRRCLR
jgi:hypothetical protein